jgi:hypothetical protein
VSDGPATQGPVSDGRATDESTTDGPSGGSHRIT